MKSLYLPFAEAFIRWTEVGQGRTLVCLPGISVPAVANFLTLAGDPGFAGWRLVMIDYLGSGLSDRPSAFDYSLSGHARAVAAVLRAEGIARADILGHSMGGSVAAALALDAPDLVGRLILAEANLDPGGGATTAPMVGLAREMGVGGAYAAVMGEVAARAREGDEFAAFDLGSWGQVAPECLIGNARALVDLPDGFAEGFLSLPIPRLFVYGEQTHPDATGGPKPDSPDPARLVARGVDVATVRGTGHEMMLSDRAAFAEAVMPWLGRG